MIALILGAQAKACPLGVNEDHLTIQRVMRNFGRFIMPAESLVYRGQNKAEKITDAELEEAIMKLSLVISCANAVIESPAGDLIPTVARSLPAAQKAKYIEKLVYFMEEFKLSVTEYQNRFIEMQTRPQNLRDFTELYGKTKEQDALIERAHQKL